MKLSAAGLPLAVSEATRLSSIATVRGAIPAADLGLVLMHEHVLVDFIGAAEIRAGRYDPDEVFRTALPHLRRVRELGCRTLVECTPAYIGRDPALLRRLSEASGLHLITNTGYYGAAEDKFVPKHAFSESADQLARRWIAEFEQGIERTGVRPGLIKIGVDAGPLSEIDSKLVRAACRTHRATSLPIASHTGDGRAALAQLAVLEEEKVPAGAFIWVHAQNERDAETHFRAAAAGAGVEFDGIGENSIERHVELVRGMIARGFLSRTLVSQDAGWYHVGEEKGGKFRGYETIFTRFIPGLRAAGVSEDQVRNLLVDNPRHALAGAG
jgi:phosphotriesterase-related protein